MKLAHLFLALPAVLLPTLVLAVPAPAAPTPQSLSLDQVVTRALAANPGLRAAGQAERAARMEARAARLTRLGRLEGIASYSRYQDDQIAQPMTRQLLGGGLSALPFDDEQVHYGVSYELPLYLGGRLTARIRVARLAARQAAALTEGSRWQIRFNAASLFAGAVALDGAAAALDQLEQTLDRTRRRLDLAVDLGKRPEVDRLKVIDQWAEARAQRADVAAARAQVGALLAALLDWPAGDSLALAPLPASLPRLQASSQQLREAVARASVGRRAELAARQAHEGVAVARADFLPSLAVRTNALRHDGPDIGDGPLSAWEVTAGVRWPLFTGGARVAALSAARARQRAAEARMTQTHLEQQARLQAALGQYRAAVQRHEAAERRQQAATEAARIEQINYNTGAGTIEDLLRARTRRQAAAAALARATGDIWVAAEQINALVEEEVVR